MMQQFATPKTEIAALVHGAATGPEKTTKSASLRSDDGNFANVFQQEQQLKDGARSTGNKGGKDEQHITPIKSPERSTAGDAENAKQENVSTKQVKDSELNTAADTDSDPAATKDNTGTDQQADSKDAECSDCAEHVEITETFEVAVSSEEELHHQWVSMLEQLKSGADAESNADAEDSVIARISQWLKEKLGAEQADLEGDSELSEEELQNLIADVLNETLDLSADDLEKILPQLQSWQENQSLGEKPLELSPELEAIEEAVVNAINGIDQDSKEVQQTELFEIELNPEARAIIEDMGITEEQLKQLLQDALSGAEGNLEANLTSEDKVLATLLALPDKQLDKALASLSQLALPEENSGADARLNFVANLKSGIMEMKAQMEQGHKPGIDLSAMIDAAVAKMTEQGQLVEMPKEQVQQLGDRLSALMLSAQSSATSDNQAQLASQAINERMIQREQNSGQLESLKQATNQTQLDKPVNITRPEGHQQLAEKVRVMVNQKNMVADIRLDPPDLGSMTIKISMQGDQASVSFVVQSQQARNVLEQATPRLSEMLAERGIELGQSSVEQQAQGNDGDAEQQTAGGSNGQDVDGEEEQLVDVTRQVASGRPGGIDFYA